MEGTVMAAVTSGEPGHRVAARAAKIARERKAHLVLLHVVDKDFLRPMAGAFHAPAAGRPGVEVPGVDILEEIASALPTGTPKPEVLVRHGQLMEQMAAAAREHDVRVLVVGAHKKRLLQMHRGHDWDRFRRELSVELVFV